MTNNKNNKSGFNLVEILFALMLTSILFAMVTVGIRRHRVNAGESEAQNNLQLICTALEAYASFNNGVYPNNASATVAEARLRQGSRPLLNQAFCGQTIDGWNYVCTLTSAENYYVAAYPCQCNTVGNKCYAVRKSCDMHAGQDCCDKTSASKCIPDPVSPCCAVGGGGGSCPLVFVSNGTKFELVSDTISNAIMGHLEIPGMPKPEIDPDEYLKINKLTPTNDGYLELRYVEVLDEVTFIDESKLIAVDHPADIEIFPNEYPSIFKPFPEFKIIQTKNLKSPEEAFNKDGRDILDYIKERDGLYIPTKKTEIKGFVETYTFTLKLGDLSKARQIQLLLNGYVTYPERSQIIEVLKNGKFKPIMPKIEVPDEKGNWKPFISQNGSAPIMMAISDFLSKTYVFDLTDAFPNNDYRIRISSNMDIHFDYFAVNTFDDYEPINMTAINPVAASLNFLGRPKNTFIKLKGKMPYFDYYKIDKSPSKNLSKGNYTRYGEVRELVTQQDNQFVIMTTGDELKVKFDSSKLPPLKKGYKRDFLLYTFGFYKPNIACKPLFNSVEPLPFKAMSSYPYPKASIIPTIKSILII